MIGDQILHWSVSGHGYEDPSYTFTIPEGVHVHFYVKSGEELKVSQGDDMWNKLIANQSKSYAEVGYQPVETFNPGSKCPNNWFDHEEVNFETGLWLHTYNPTPPYYPHFTENDKNFEGAYLKDIIQYVLKLSNDNDNIDIDLHVFACRLIYNHDYYE